MMTVAAVVLVVLDSFLDIELLHKSGGNPYPYTIPGGGAPVTPRGTDGNPGGDTTINDPTGVIFSLTGGGSGYAPQECQLLLNDTRWQQLAPITAQPPYGSHGGGGGGIQVARDNNPNLRPTDGTPGAYGDQFLVAEAVVLG